MSNTQTFFHRLLYKTEPLYSLKEKVESAIVPGNYCLISLDIVSVCTNIPVDITDSIKYRTELTR